MAAVIAIVSFQLVGSTRDGAAAIDSVQAAVDKVLTEQRTRTEASGASFSVSWQATPMPGGQMVRTTIRSSAPSVAGQAVFMVDELSGEVIPQDQHAATLLGPGATPMPHR